jgi:hypothetical protein
MKKSILYVCLAVLFWQGVSFAAFIDNGNGTITDTGTGLMWQKATAPGTYTWEQALTYCENLILGGHSDWRLPNRNELQSIVDYSRYNPAIDTTFFPGTVASFYWSSTTFANLTTSAWFVDFYFGFVGSYYKSDYGYVRAVRGGQCGGFGDLPLFVQPFSQNDERWRDKQLGSCFDSDGSFTTIGEKGCAVTSLAMVTNYFNPCYPTNPQKLNDCLKDADSYMYCDGYCCIFPEGSHTYSCAPGVDLERINRSASADDPVYLQTIKDELANGNPVIVRVPLSEGVHFIVMYFNDNGSLQFFDPLDGLSHTWPQGTLKTPYSFASIIKCHPTNGIIPARCDGLPPTELLGPDGTDTGYDGNGDTLPDWQQSNVSSFHSYDRQSYVTLVSPLETTMSNVQAVDNPSLADVPLYVDFQQQFFSFTINNVTGGLAVVKLYLPVGSTINTYYKYGPTPDNPMFHWYKFMYDGATGTGALISDNIITLYFMDGLRGDDDLTPNGTIMDVGGPGNEGEATVVTLSSFVATPKAGKIIVVWTTESEIDNAGFNVYRAKAKDGKYSKINTALIPAKGSATQGASYEFTDTNVQNRKTYWYKLEDINLNGTSTMHEPVSATPRLIFGFWD